MVPILCMLGALTLMIVGLIANWLHPTKVGKYAVSVGIVAFTIFALLCICLNAGAKTDITSITERYEDLMLYHSTVVNSDNEYVRYNYYDKVVAFNEDLEGIMSASNSNWTNWFYSAEELATVHPIDFTLHGDNFYGEG